MALAAVVAACGGGGEANPAIEQRGGSCSYDHVYVTVERVRVLQQAAGGEQWIEIALPTPQRIDLKNLTGGVLQALGVAPLQAGQYIQVRLVLTDGSVHPTGAAESPLDFVGGPEGGLKLQGDFTVPAGQTGDVLLQGFDPCKAVVQTGRPNSPSYQLKPTADASVQLVSIAETRIPSGTVTAVITGGYMAAQSPSDNVRVLQRVGPGGQPVGPEVTITVPSMTPNDWGLTVAPLTGGGYAATWLKLVELNRLGLSVYEVMTQAFTSTGAPIGSPLAIGESVPAKFAIMQPMSMPQVAALTNGGYVVVWALGRGLDTALHAQRFNDDGTPAAAAHQVTANASGNLAVVGLSTGGYLVSWVDNSDPANRLAGFVRTYGGDDTPLGSEQSGGPSGPATFGTAPAMAPLAGGGAVLVWQYRAADGPSEVFVQRIAPDGIPFAVQTIFVSSAASSVSRFGSPAVVGLPDGGYVVAWLVFAEVHAQRFAADGTAAGAEARVNLVTSSAEGPIGAVPMAGGSFMISWSGIGPDGVRASYGRIFPANGLLGG